MKLYTILYVVFASTLAYASVTANTIIQRFLQTSRTKSSTEALTYLKNAETTIQKVAENTALSDRMRAPYIAALPVMKAILVDLIKTRSIYVCCHAVASNHGDAALKKYADILSLAEELLLKHISYYIHTI